MPGRRVGARSRIPALQAEARSDCEPRPSAALTDRAGSLWRKGVAGMRSLLFAIIRAISACLLLQAMAVEGLAAEEMRFPAPEFKSDYVFPATTTPDATSQLRQWVDLGIFTAALSLASWLAV